MFGRLVAILALVAAVSGVCLCLSCRTMSARCLDAPILLQQYAASKTISTLVRRGGESVEMTFCFILVDEGLLV